MHGHPNIKPETRVSPDILMEQQNAGSPADVAPTVNCKDNDGMPEKAIK
jgi:hypothetical protein